MCNFISWIDLNSEIFYLDDTKLNTKEGRELLIFLGDKVKDDLPGHGAIRHYYPELGNKGTNHECEDFSHPKNYPSQIVSAIKKGLFEHFGICPDILNKPARAEYEKIEGLAWAEYEKIEGPAWAEYKKIKGPALAIKRLAWAEYEKIKGPALAEYKKIKRLAFWKIARLKKNRISNWK